MRLTRLLSVTAAAGVVLACQGSPDLGPDSRSPEPAAAAALSAVAVSNTWSGTAPMLAGRSFLGAAASNGILYVAGGGFCCQNGNPLPSRNLQAYDIRTNTWSARKPLPVAWGWGNGASFVDGRLYITGGANAGISKALYVYNPATDSWTRKADMPQVVGSGAQGVIAGQLYVFGGGGPGPGVLLRYDPATNRWTKRASLPVSGELPAAGVIGGKLYVAGGAYLDSPIANVYAYDPATNAWSARAPMPTAYFGAASAVANKKLYVIGGATCWSCDGEHTLQVYDPATNGWTVKRPVPTGRVGAAAAVAAGKIYVAGGYSTDRYGIASVEAYTP